MKFLITGFPGTGKTTISRALKERGYNSYDPEKMRGYMHLEDRATGHHIHRPADAPRGWFDTTGAYNLDIPRVSHLLESHDEVIICTLADNQEEFYELFDKVLLLVLDDYDLEKRLIERPNSTYGKNANDRADTLMLHRHFEQSLIEHGAVKINASKPLDHVIRRILEEIRLTEQTR